MKTKQVGNIMIPTQIAKSLEALNTFNNALIEAGMPELDELDEEEEFEDDEDDDEYTSCEECGHVYSDRSPFCDCEDGAY